MGDVACWKCGGSLESHRITFRETCPSCGVDLHCCVTCKFYEPGQPNDCRVPGTDPVRDREASNLCEEFQLLGKPPGPPPSLDAFNTLFKD